jgi:acyl-coenzyme A synthetase/AMP-(fatty) acid ligase
LSKGEIQQHCANLLPRYMVPGTIELRSELPRTSSGKVDRQALKALFCNSTPISNSEGLWQQA